jgi:hypothetical protein
VAFTASVDPGHVSVQPGGAPVTAAVNGQTIAGKPGTINWKATAPAGFTVTPSSGTLAVPASGPARAPFTITVAAGVKEGWYSIPVTFTGGDGSPLPPSGLSLTVAQPDSLLWHYNNTGISDDTAPGNANLDGGGWSLSAQALAAAGVKPGGTVTAGGFTFPWPADPVAKPDNVRAAGQRLALPNQPGTKLSLLGNGTYGNASGTATIGYADGTTQSVTIGFGDWTLGAGKNPPQFGNQIAVTMPYRNSGGGKDAVTTYLFATAPIDLLPGKQATSITLPTTVTGGALHVFGVMTG